MISLVRVIALIPFLIFSFPASSEQIGNVNVQVSYASYCHVVKMPSLYIENDRWPVTKNTLSVHIDCNVTSNAQQLVISLPKKQESVYYKSIVTQKRAVRAKLASILQHSEKVSRVIPLVAGHSSFSVDFDVVVINKRRLIGPISIDFPLDIDLL